MSLEVIPDNWIDLLETDEMVKSWHRDTQNGTLPTADVQQTISYIERHYPEDCKRMIAKPDGLPQSFVCWWCHSLHSEIYGHRPHYPALNHWLQNIKQDHKDLCDQTEMDEVLVITVLATWLDILFTDIILFDNEKIRSKIPRMYCNQQNNIRCGQWEAPSSRRDTLNYIIQGGLSIFKERGFKEGEEYWKNLCKKYKI
jgi:hypothetical protein